ncbi:MAG: hypothetical protein GVY05_02440 [Bacteroidetes bacterium]|jgi:hypothetical protein|nr:hypothetical protein [Bacteroidota bacterium]
MKRLHNLIFVILLFGVIFSCHQPKEKEMDDFLTAKIETINKSDSSIGLTLRDQNDAMHFAALSKIDFTNYDDLISKIEIDKPVEVRGVIYQFNRSKNFYKLFNSSHPDSSSSIIVVKEINFSE